MTLANMRENGVGSGVATCAMGAARLGLGLKESLPGTPHCRYRTNRTGITSPLTAEKVADSVTSALNRRGETPSVQRIRWIAVLTLAAYQPVLALERDCSTADQRHERLAKLVEMTDGLRNTIERVPPAETEFIRREFREALIQDNRTRAALVIKHPYFYALQVHDDVEKSMMDLSR